MTDTPKPASGLRQRVITAAVLAPLGIAGVVLLPQLWFAIGIGLLFVVGAWEWAKLAGWQSSLARIVVLAAHVALFAHAWFASDAARVQIIWSGVAFWLLSPLWLHQFRFGAEQRRRSLLLKTIAGLLVIVPAWTAAIVLHGGDRGAWWVLFVIVLVWVADSCAYFAGRRYGTTKLAPNISPGKTRAGVYGALAGAVVYAGLVGHFGFAISPSSLPTFIGLCLVTVVFSVIGDLLESLIKRHAQVKDSGTLFPGHGGALDRFDSLFAALPIFVAGRHLFGP
jgi:phosphatidate cytidylyltransferase